jgi:hypothetical protein
MDTHDRTPIDYDFYRARALQLRSQMLDTLLVRFLAFLRPALHHGPERPTASGSGSRCAHRGEQLAKQVVQQ